MRIDQLYKQGRQLASFEVFPPKRDSDIGAIYKALEEMAALAPDFISVTYGAGGEGGVNKTAEIARVIAKEHQIPSMAHLTCISSSAETIQEKLNELRALGVENILALRGDLPATGEKPSKHFAYAEDLIGTIRARGDFCIGAACYPEGHLDCTDDALDIIRLRRKQDAGASFFVSQLFFENDSFLRFLERARRAGVTAPISAGVMPILGRAQIERMIFLCGASLPSKIIKLLHKYANSPADLRKAGIEYAARQLAGLLASGVDGVHIYTMNKADIATACMGRIGRI